MNKIPLEIKGLTFSESSSGTYVLVLGDVHSRRRLPIVIGANEAQSIAMGLEGLKNSRPLTHDLFKKFMESYDIELMEVVLTRFKEGVFYAVLICRRGEDFTTMDARPSDAIAMAVRCGCPISAYETVMEEAGIEIPEEEEQQEEEHGSVREAEPSRERSYDDYTDGELEDLLNEAVDEEDYERAAMIRDLLKKRGV